MVISFANALADTVAKDAAIQSPGAVGVRDVATMKWTFSGSFSSNAADEVFWTTGTLTVPDGRAFTIDSPIGGSTGTLADVEYIYFDLDSPTTFISTPTLDDTIGINKILIAYGKLSTVGTEAEFFVYDGTPVPWQVDGSSITSGSVTAGEIANDSLTNALLKKGARSFSTDLEIRGTAYNQIIWDNGTALTDATITYGDASSDTIADGTKTTGLADSTTYYAYISVTGGSPKVLTFSTTHSDAISDDNLLLAIIVIGVALDGNAPTILPFNSKVPTINAIAIAADSITTDHLTAELILSTTIIAGNDGTSQRWELNTSGIRGYNSSNVLQVQLLTTASASGGKIVGGETGSEKFSLDAAGVHIIRTTSIDSAQLSFRDTFEGADIAVLGLNATNLTLIADVDLNLTTTTSADINLTPDGTINLNGGASVVAGNFNVGGHVLPTGTTGTRDLGNTSAHWGELWIDDIKTPLTMTGLLTMAGDIDPSGSRDLGNTTNVWRQGWFTDVYTDGLTSESGSSIVVNDDFSPNGGGNYDLGDATNYWNNIYGSYAGLYNAALYHLYVGEQTAPGTSANNIILYALVNGAATELRALFPDGTDRLIATE